jgi:hypothetical protein
VRPLNCRKPLYGGNKYKKQKKKEVRRRRREEEEDEEGEEEEKLYSDITSLLTIADGRYNNPNRSSRRNIFCNI